MILLIDNYDSFVYNLARYLQEMDQEVSVVRNNALSLNDVQDLSPRAIVISPGPSTPDRAGITLDLIRRFHPSIPLLGVCLGHQAIAQALGGRVIRASQPVHGKTSLAHHDGSGLFCELPAPLEVTRYHSLIVEENSLPDCLRVISRTATGVIMGIAHQTLPVFGVQFHPESIMTEQGHRLLQNFLRIAGIPVDSCPAGDQVSSAEEKSDPEQYPPPTLPAHW